MIFMVFWAERRIEHVCSCGMLSNGDPELCSSTIYVRRELVKVGKVFSSWIRFWVTLTDTTFRVIGAKTRTYHTKFSMPVGDGR